MVMIPNRRFPQETERPETVKQSENRPSIDAEAPKYGMKTDKRKTA